MDIYTYIYILQFSIIFWVIYLKTWLKPFAPIREKYLLDRWTGCEGTCTMITCTNQSAVLLEILFKFGDIYLKICKHLAKNCLVFVKDKIWILLSIHSFYFVFEVPQGLYKNCLVFVKYIWKVNKTLFHQKSFLFYIKT